MFLIHVEKRSRHKLESTHPVLAKKTFPPVFLKGLTDLKVMDGSQVIMTVEVSGGFQCLLNIFIES